MLTNKTKMGGCMGKLEGKEKEIDAVLLEIEGYSEGCVQNVKRLEGNGLFNLFQSFQSLLKKGSGDLNEINFPVFKDAQETDDLFKKYESYLSEGVGAFVLNLHNGNLEGFEANSSDPVFALFVVGLYYGVKSHQYKLIKNDVFDGTKYDPKFEGIIISYLSHIERKACKPERRFFGEFYVEEADPNCYRLPNMVTIALFADWATGTTSSINLLKEVAKFNPDYAIHLGDTYYSGTEDEQRDNLVNPLKKFLPDARCMTVPGNHDWYSGNDGISYALKALNQHATFFSLYNDSFQIEACDTGFGDSDPFLTFTETAHNTKIEHEEMEWHNHRFQQARANKRRVIILSHHMPVAPWAPSGNVGGKLSPINPDLLDQFKDFFDVTEAWLFGHDHSFCLMEPYEYKGMVLKRPILIGNGACQYRENTLEHYETEETLEFEDKETPPPKPKPLFPGKFESYLNNSFVILKLEDDKATLSYYEIPQVELNIYTDPHLIHTETF